MSAEALAVTFANRRQLLEAVLTLPDELGQDMYYLQGSVAFNKKRKPDPDSPKSQHFIYYNFDGLEAFIPHPNEASQIRESIKPSQILLRLGVPNRVTFGTGIYDISKPTKDNRRVIELFKVSCLPLISKYQIDNALFDEIIDRDRRLRVPEMTLLVKGGSDYEHEHHNSRLGEPFSIAIKRGSIDGWFKRILDANRERFIYRDEDISTVYLLDK